MFQDSVPAGSYNDPFLSSVCTCMREYVYACICACVYKCAYMCICLYVYMNCKCIYIYTIIYVRYVYIHTGIALAVTVLLIVKKGREMGRKHSKNCLWNPFAEMTAYGDKNSPNL